MILSLNSAPALQRAGFGIIRFLQDYDSLSTQLVFVVSRCMRYKCIEIESE